MQRKAQEGKDLETHAVVRRLWDADQLRTNSGVKSPEYCAPHIFICFAVLRDTLLLKLLSDALNMAEPE